MTLTFGASWLGARSQVSDTATVFRENVELKQLLKAKEAELSFMRDDELPSDPYIESLKREIVRKDKIIADERCVFRIGIVTLS